MPLHDAIRIDDVDQRAMDAAISEMRARGEIGDASGDDLEVVMFAALLAGHRDASAAVKASIALLAAEAHLRGERHLAPTADLRPAPAPARHRGASWFGLLTTEEED